LKRIEEELRRAAVLMLEGSTFDRHGKGEYRRRSSPVHSAIVPPFSIPHSQTATNFPARITSSRDIILRVVVLCRNKKEAIVWPLLGKDKSQLSQAKEGVQSEGYAAEAGKIVCPRAKCNASTFLSPNSRDRCVGPTCKHVNSVHPAARMVSPEIGIAYALLKAKQKICRRSRRFK
jgi:hypothetical protein